MYVSDMCICTKKNFLTEIIIRGKKKFVVKPTHQTFSLSIKKSWLPKTPH